MPQQVVNVILTLLEVYFLCCVHPGQSLTAFKFSPIDANGVLTACVGSHVSLKCSHGNDASGVTRWVFSTPINCSETIDHNPPIITRPCGPFTFQDVTTKQTNGLFNSTAVAIASASMTGTIAECRDSSGSIYNQIGTTSICIIDQPKDLVVIKVNGAYVVVWDGVTCPGAMIIYKVEVTQVNKSVSTEVIVTATMEVTLTALQSNVEYTVAVRAVTSTCFSVPAITNFVAEIEASAGETQLAAVGIGVGIAVAAASIAVIIAVITTILVFIKIRSRTNCATELNPDNKSQTILEDQLSQHNAYVSGEEIAKSMIEREESSDALPTLYAVTVLAAPEKSSEHKIDTLKPSQTKNESSPAHILTSPSKGPPKPPRIRPESSKGQTTTNSIA